jgi:hypothetical protein
MASTPSIKILMSREYKGGTKTFSNRYHVTGPDWASSGQFSTFAGAVKDALKVALPAEITITGAVAYNAGSDLPVYSVTYSQAGTATLTSTNIPPLEVSALLRWTTTQRTSKNHPIYLFTYIRGARLSQSSAYEAIGSTQQSLLNTYATAWVTGWSDGTQTRHRAGPNGAVAQAGACEDWATHRDFPG